MRVVSLYELGRHSGRYSLPLALAVSHRSAQKLYGIHNDMRNDINGVINDLHGISNDNYGIHNGTRNDVSDDLHGNNYNNNNIESVNAMLNFADIKGARSMKKI